MYFTQQRDVFRSGLAAEIGVYAYSVWNAIKSHSDFNTGDSYPGIRRLCRLTGICDQTVQSSLKVLQEFHLLRVKKRGRKPNHYVARERMDVRVGDRVICTVVIDYIPAQMRDRVAKLKEAAKGEIDCADVWAQVDLIPGKGMKLDEETGTFMSEIRADDVPHQISQTGASVRLQSPAEAKRSLKELADELRVKTRVPVPKK
jgi:hypothetical protein